MVGELDDPRRTEPSFVSDELTMLESWLEFHRATLLLKCEGLDRAGLIARPVATSKLSLHGLVRHMAEVERNWFARVLLRAPDTPPHFYDPAVEDSELVPLDTADWEDDRTVWRDECARSREVAARFSLDDTGLRRGRECSLGWIYVHIDRGIRSPQRPRRPHPRTRRRRGRMVTEPSPRLPRPDARSTSGALSA